MGEFEELTASIWQIFGRKQGKITLTAHSFGDAELAEVSKCIESTMVSTVGDYVQKFEKELGKFTESPHIICCSSGTAGLHLALDAVGVSKNTEVIMPAISFVATANASVYLGAQPWFVDCENETFGICPTALKSYLEECRERGSKYCPLVGRSGAPVKAIVAVHVLGHPCKIKQICEVANEFALPVVEDAAGAMGSFLGDTHVGLFGDVGVVSFNGNKIITSGGGGAILTRSGELSESIRHMSTVAKLHDSWRFQHDRVGFNYRMPALNAALGYAQLKELPVLLNHRRNLFHYYENITSQFTDIRMVKEPPDCRSNYWLHSIVLSERVSALRDQMLETSNRSGLMTRPLWDLLPEQAPYRHIANAGSYSCAKSIVESVISIPSHSLNNING